MELIFATSNTHKLREAQEILGCDFSILSLKDLGLTEDIPETAETIEGNALLKADYLWSRYEKACFADDTGLEVDFLGGEPGVYSARYAGEECDSSKNIQKLLKEMKGADNRNARFRTVVTLIIEGERYFFEGILNGRILSKPVGDNGFGYDSVFLPNKYKESLAEISSVEKNRISHRGKAMRKLSLFLKSYHIL